LRKLRTTPIVKLLLVFAVTFSMATLSGPLSSHFALPSLQLAKANPAPAENWIPAGPSMNTFLGHIFTDESAEFTDIQSASPSVDLTDWPLTPGLISGTTAICTQAGFFCTSSISEHGYFEIQFMLDNNYWGINFNFGNDANGVQIRQGIAHLVDKVSFVNNEPTIKGISSAIDNPLPTSNGGLPSPNPCAWDVQFPESGANCIVGAPGGTSYHLASATGTGTPSVWQQSLASTDFCAASQHFINAFTASGLTGVTRNTNCVLLAPGQTTPGVGWPTSVTNNVPNFYVRSDNTPRLHLGDSFAQSICALFTGNFVTGCLGFLNVTHGPITSFTGFTTSTTSIDQGWWMYTAAFGSVFPFDSSLYFGYNSRFVSGIPADKPPCDPASVPSAGAGNYMYVCNSAYDSISHQMEFANCLAAQVGTDPAPSDPLNTTHSGSCTAGGLSAVTAGVLTEDTHGKNAFTIPIFQQADVFAYLSNWQRVQNNQGSGVPNFYSWLNAYSASPSQSGTIRQAFKQTTRTTSPYIASTVWDFYMVGNIYDSLGAANPASNAQLLDWMTISSSQLANGGLTYTPPSGTTQTFRFTLRSDLFFQDGRKVTSFDIAFSYMSLLGTGAFQSGGASPTTGITILSPTQFDINVASVGPFTKLFLTGLTVLPGRDWTFAGASAYDGATASCTATGASCFPAQYSLSATTFNTATPPACITGCIPGSNIPMVLCTLTCSFAANNLNVNPPQTTATYDPINNHILIGSGPWTCGTGSGLGQACVTGPPFNQNPGAGSSYTLQRYGVGLAPASAGSYFRSAGNLALYFWAEDNGDFTHDFLNFGVVAACYGQATTALGGIPLPSSCAHFQQGIGANGGPKVVDVTTVGIVNRFVGVNWVQPFQWSTSPPVNIVAPTGLVLHEGGVTLNPASVAGCTPVYPTGGYDC
jgi:hypothetical protein